MQIYRVICFLTALTLFVATLSDFSEAIIAQRKVLLDGPLAWASNYAFYLNRLALVVLFSALTVPNYDIILSRRAKSFFRVTGVVILLSAFTSFTFILAEQISIGMSFDVYAQTYLYQFAITLSSILIIYHGFKPIRNREDTP